MRIAPVLLAFAAAGCATEACATAPRAPTSEPSALAYTLEPPAAGVHAMRVTARLDAVTRLTAPEELRAAVTSIDARDVRGARAVTTTRQGWTLDPCAAPCTIRYVVDFDRLVRACAGQLDCAMRSGETTIAPASQFFVLPEGSDDAAIAVTTRGAGPSAIGIRRGSDGAYRLRGRELAEASYVAFGPLRHAAAPSIDIAIVDAKDAPFAMSDAAIARWVRDASALHARFFGRFPAPATLFVIPSPGASSVRFGSVSARTGASIALFVGDRMPATTAAEHDDWVLVHELFHVGTPTFVGEGRWLEEGLATYYEPILRARAGWISEAALWGHFADQMRRGVRPAGSDADIEARDDIDSTYWGGALFALLADVRIRVATSGARSLVDVLRAVLAHDGDVTHVWSVSELLAFGDRETGTTILHDLRASFARGAAIDLGRELAALGVTWREGEKEARLDDDAPRSAVRKAIGRW